LADLSLIFSLVWKIWLLFVISVNFIPYWESLHTHALHELSNLFKISICREICAYWILNSHLYLCNAIWLLYQLIIHACSETNFWEKYFSTYFPQVSNFQVWSILTDLFFVQTRAVLPYADLVVAHPDMISIGLRLASLSLPYTDLCIFIDLSYHVVCFPHGFLPRFWHSLHISSHPMIFIVSSIILLSFCAFRIL